MFSDSPSKHAEEMYCIVVKQYLFPLHYAARHGFVCSMLFKVSIKAWLTRGALESQRDSKEEKLNAPQQEKTSVTEPIGCHLEATRSDMSSVCCSMKYLRYYFAVGL